MKKLLRFISIIFIFSLILTGCSSKEEHIKEISFNEFKEKIESKDSFALYIGNKNCSHCVSYLPTLKSVLNKYNITIYHLDNSKLSDSEQTNLKTYASISGTPTVLFITDGEEETTLNRIVGETTKEETIEIFKTNGYIK